MNFDSSEGSDSELAESFSSKCDFESDKSEGKKSGSHYMEKIHDHSESVELEEVPDSELEESVSSGCVSKRVAFQSKRRKSDCHNLEEVSHSEFVKSVSSGCASKPSKRRKSDCHISEEMSNSVGSFSSLSSEAVKLDGLKSNGKESGGHVDELSDSESIKSSSSCSSESVQLLPNDLPAHKENKLDLLKTFGDPSYNHLLQKHFPELLPAIKRFQQQRNGQELWTPDLDCCAETLKRNDDSDILKKMWTAFSDFEKIYGRVENRVIFEYTSHKGVRFQITCGDFKKIFLFAHNSKISGRHYWMNDALIDFYVNKVFDECSESVREKIILKDAFFYKRLNSRPWKDLFRFIEEITQQVKEAGETKKELEKVIELHKKRIAFIDELQRALEKKDMKLYSEIHSKFSSFKALKKVKDYEEVYKEKERYFLKCMQNYEEKCAVYLRKSKGFMNETFTKDFVVIPISIDNCHWIVCIILFPKLVENGIFDTVQVEGADIPGLPQNLSNESGMNENQQYLNYFLKRKRPCLLILDSLLESNFSNSHTEIFAKIREHLEWEYNETHENKKIYFNEETLPGYIVKVPQQHNALDCGIMVMHNINYFFKTINFYYQYGTPLDLDWWSENYSSACLRYNILHFFEERKELLCEVKQDEPKAQPRAQYQKYPMEQQTLQKLQQQNQYSVPYPVKQTIALPTGLYQNQHPVLYPVQQQATTLPTVQCQNQFQIQHPVQQQAAAFPTVLQQATPMHKKTEPDDDIEILILSSDDDRDS